MGKGDWQRVGDVIGTDLKNMAIIAAGLVAATGAVSMILLDSTDFVSKFSHLPVIMKVCWGFAGIKTSKLICCSLGGLIYLLGRKKED